MFSIKKRKAVDNSKDEAVDNYKDDSLDNLIITGIDGIIKNELSRYEMDKIEEKKEREQFEATYGAFSLWADDYFTKDKLNTFVVLYGAVAQFRKDTPYKWNIKYFKENLEEWCEAKKYKINPPESIGRRGKCHDDLEKYYDPTVFIKTE